MDGASAIELARRLDPDVVTMDIGLPDMTGLEVTSELRAEMPEVRVVVVTMHDESEYRDEAERVGAASYIVKQSLLHELPACLDRLATQFAAQRPGHAR